MPEFEEVKSGCSACEEKSSFYNEDGQLVTEKSSEIFLDTTKEDLLKLDHKLVVDALLDSREVFNQQMKMHYVNNMLLASAMRAINGDKNFIELFKKLTNDGTRNMTSGEWEDMVIGFTFERSEVIEIIMMLDKMAMELFDEEEEGD